MLDFLAPLLGGALTEYCRSRRISKTKIFSIFFLVFTGIFIIVGFVARPNEIQLNITLGVALGLIVATIMVIVLALDENSERKKKQSNEEKTD